MSGIITFNGQPLDQGRINFEPVEGAYLSTGVIIANGRFEIPGNKGLPPGKYRVTITSGDQEAAEKYPPGEYGQRPPPERIPAKWNSKSKEFITITDEGPNEFHFVID